MPRNTTPSSHQRAPVYRPELLGFLFSDIKGYSNLSEHLLLEYALKIVPEIASLVRPQESHWVEVNTWGDAMFLVSSDVGRLAEVALSIRNFFATHDWKGHGFGEPLAIRIGVHCAQVNRFPDNPIAMVNRPALYGTDVALAARIEPVVPPNQILVTTAFRHNVERFDNIAFHAAGKFVLPKEAGTADLYYMTHARECAPVYEQNRPIEALEWSDANQRKEPILRGIAAAKAGETIRFVSITGKSILLPDPAPRITLETSAVVQALKREVRFQGVLLDPGSTEAATRASIETPKAAKDRTLLQHDARRVRADLRAEYEEVRVTQKQLEDLDLRYSPVGLAFSLWLFPDHALMEPYHFGKDERCGEHLCSFPQFKIPKQKIQYSLLEKHFDVMWKMARPVWNGEENG